MGNLQELAQRFLQKAGTQTEPFSGRQLDRLMTDAELARAIRLDLEAEMDAINLYTAHLEATKNAKAIAILQHIIKEEKDHAALFVELIKSLDPEQEDIWEKGREYFEETIAKK